MPRKQDPSWDDHGGIDKVPAGFPDTPFLMNDVASVVGSRILVLERSVGAWRGVRFSVPYGYILDEVMADDNCSPTGKRGCRFYPWEHNESVRDVADKNFQTHCEAMRSTAKQNGATPEAIRLLHGFKPLTKNEVTAMAEKLAKKTDKPKAAKAEAAPKAKGKGNPEALAKARAARAEAGPDVRKITVINKENPYREGSNRATSFEALLAKTTKTVQDYVDAGGAKKYIARWEAEGVIKLS